MTMSVYCRVNKSLPTLSVDIGLHVTGRRRWSGDCIRFGRRRRDPMFTR